MRQRYDFNFKIVNFPFICDICIKNTEASEYGVYAAKIMTCTPQFDYDDIRLLLGNKLLTRVFTTIRLFSLPFKRFFGRQRVLVDPYLPSCFNCHTLVYLVYDSYQKLATIPLLIPGADSGGGGAPPKIRKNMIFWRKIVIFHTKYPKNVRASLRSAQFF